MRKLILIVIFGFVAVNCFAKTVQYDLKPKSPKIEICNSEELKITQKESKNHLIKSQKEIVEKNKKLMEFLKQKFGLKLTTSKEYKEQFPLPIDPDARMVFDTRQIREDMHRKEKTHKEPIRYYKKSELLKIIKQSPNSDRGKVLVVVNASLYCQSTHIQDALYQYAEDVYREGYDVEIIEFSGGTAEYLRNNILRPKYENDNLVGALLIGNIPTAWLFSIDDVLSEYPFDYYYMDLDGLWIDTDGDTVIDTHLSGDGDENPEIWVGRITAHPYIFEDEGELIANYFRKNHAYRIGELTLRQRALMYVDDDFVSLYSDLRTKEFISKINYDEGYHYYGETDEDVTTSCHYKSLLESEYEFIHLCTHSSPWSHAFDMLSSPFSLPEPFADWVGGIVFSSDIKQIDPKAFFYLLDACSTGRFTSVGYIGGRYIFSDSYGLLAIANTRYSYFQESVSLEKFYANLDSGKSFGQAFKEQYDDYVDFCPEKGYYTVILGDPTLKIKNYNKVDKPSDKLSLLEYVYIDASQNGVIESEELITLYVTVVNTGRTVKDAEATLSTYMPTVTGVPQVVNMGDVLSYSE